jgi:hypothetical protein
LTFHSTNKLSFLTRRPILPKYTIQIITMSVTQIFLLIQKHIYGLTGTSILAIAAEMAGFVLLELILEYLFPMLFISLIFCHIFPIYFASHEPWTVARFRSYIKYVFKAYFAGILVYVAICVPFAYIVLRSPKSFFNRSVGDMRECAYRFEEIECTRGNNGYYPRAWGVQKECLALAMCLRQPLFLLRIYTFLSELSAQVLSQRSFNSFIFLTGAYVAWGLTSGRWISGLDSDTPINDIHKTGTTILDATTPIVEAGAPENALGIEGPGPLLQRVPSFRRTPAGASREGRHFLLRRHPAFANAHFTPDPRNPLFGPAFRPVPLHSPLFVPTSDASSIRHNVAAPHNTPGSQRNRAAGLPPTFPWEDEARRNAGLDPVEEGGEIPRAEGGFIQVVPEAPHDIAVAEIRNSDDEQSLFDD